MAWANEDSKSCWRRHSDVKIKLKKSMNALDSNLTTTKNLSREFSSGSLKILFQVFLELQLSNQQNFDLENLIAVLWQHKLLDSTQFISFDSRRRRRQRRRRRCHRLLSIVYEPRKRSSSLQLVSLQIDLALANSSVRLNGITAT